MNKRVIKEIDLLDEICPMTFVKTKLAILKDPSYNKKKSSFISIIPYIYH